MESNKRYQFHVNSANVCFLCLKNVAELENNNFEGDTNLNSSQIHSLKIMFSYLNMDLTSVKSVSNKPLSILKRTEVKVSSCDECGTAIKLFTDFYKAMEVARMQAEHFVKVFSEKLETSKDNQDLLETYEKVAQENSKSSKHYKIVQELRNAISQKCTRKVQSFQPKVSIERIVPFKTTINQSGPAAKLITAKPGGNDSNVLDTIATFNKHPQPYIDKDSGLDKDDYHHTEDNYEHDDDNFARVTDHSEANQEFKPKIPNVRSIKANRHRKHKLNKKSGRFPCNFCPKVFTSVYTCEKHRKIHTGQAPTCPVCSRSFPYKHGLIVHMRTHTGERPFKCRFCHKGFTDKSNLKVHVGKCHFGMVKRRMNGISQLKEVKPENESVRSYECKVCQEKFSDAFDLEAHFKLKHQPDHALSTLPIVNVKNEPT